MNVQLVGINNFNFFQVNNVTLHRRRNFGEALADCVSKGGNLASFHSAADIDTVWRNALMYVIVYSTAFLYLKLKFFINPIIKEGTSQ